MLPRPRRRIDPEQARARLIALRDGHLLDHDDVDSVEPADTGENPWSRSSTWTRWGSSSVRPVVVAIGLTAVVMWVLTHLSTMETPTVVTIASGTPIPVTSLANPPSSLPPAATPSVGVPSPIVGTIVVQILGEVHEPGLVTLPVGARVSDAIAAAGGLLSRKSSGGLNLARRVVDGEQIVVSHVMPTAIPGSGAVPSNSSGGSGPLTVDLNSADLAALDALPGVGPVMAARILTWREQHGRFNSIDQLREIAGIGQRTFERLRPYVHV